jgi:hypothetical protein
MKTRLRKYLLSLHIIGIKSRGINLCLNSSPVSRKPLQLHFEHIGYPVHLKLGQLQEAETMQNTRIQRSVLRMQFLRKKKTLQTQQKGIAHEIKNNSFHYISKLPLTSSTIM